MAMLAPAQEVVLHVVFSRPVGKGPAQRAPNGATFPVRYREIRNRLASIVAQTGKTRRKTPARLELPALGRAAIEGEDPALARLGGLKGDLQAVTEQATGTDSTAVMMTSDHTPSAVRERRAGMLFLVRSPPCP
jgi:hypothetical protein